MKREREPFEQIPFDELPERPRREHDYDETEGRDVDVVTCEFGEVATHYRVFGEGEPLLLIHGLMTSSYSWRYAFRGLGEEYRVYAPDLPGAGETEKIVGAEYDPRDLADWVAAFQRVVDIRGCPVIGNSLGGYIGMWLALRDPDALDSLVNLHSPGIPTFRLRALRTLADVPGVSRLIAWMARRRPESWAHSHVHYYDESLKSREEAEVYGEPLESKEGSMAFAKYLTESLDSGIMREFVEELEHRRDQGLGFPVPLLLLYAEHDPVVPAEVGEELTELIPGAEYRCVEDASHFVHVDAPEEFVERSLAFLADHDE